MVADTNGNIFIASSVTAQAQGLAFSPSSVSVTKLDRNNHVVYTFSFGGQSATGFANPYAIALDQQGNVIVVGAASSSGLPLVNALITSGPPEDCCNTGFVAKINAGGTQLLFSTFLGGTTDDSNSNVNAVTVDASDHILLTGTTGSADFPVTPNAYQHPACNGSTCSKYTEYAFVTKLSNSGDEQNLDICELRCRGIFKNAFIDAVFLFPAMRL